jgi:hypothetical protein
LHELTLRRTEARRPASTTCVLASWRPNRTIVEESPELLVPCAVEGNVPRLGLLVSVEEAYTECPKALIRSDLWNPEHDVDRSKLPSSGEILRSLTEPTFDADAYDRERAERYAHRERLD